MFVDGDCEEVGGDVGADVGGDQGAAVDVGVGVYADAEFVGLAVEGGGVTVAVAEVVFDVGLVGFCPMGSTSMPKRMSRMVVFPTATSSTMCRRRILRARTISPIS